MPFPSTRRLRLTALVAAPLVVVGLLAVRDEAAPAPRLNPPAAIHLLGSEQLTPAQVTEIAGAYRVVALNAWETEVRDRIKDVNPTVTVLVYKDLSSTRTSEPRDPDAQGAAPETPTGVSVHAAPDAWFARDARTGARLPWAGYPDHLQMQTWNPDYRRAWVEQVTRAVAGTAWDGVLADNANHSTAYAPGSGLDARLVEQGTLDLVREAGTALRAQGKLLVPNVESARLKPDSWWTALSAFGGASEEQFAHFGDGGFVHDYPDHGIRRQGWQLASLPEGALPLVRTTSTDTSVPGRVDDDDRAFAYGYSAFLVWGGGRGAFSIAGRDRSTYADAVLRPEQTWHVGAPRDPAPSTRGVREGGLTVVARELDGVFAAVNVSRSRTAPVQVPPGRWADAAGREVTGTVELAPFDALLLRRT